jgi:hypothetical protein
MFGWTHQWYCPPLMGAMDVYSAMEKTLLNAKIAVKMKDQKTPPVPPFNRPGVRDLIISAFVKYS